MRRLPLSVSILFALVAVSLGATAQGPPESLKFTVPDHYFVTGNKLQPGNATAAACPPTLVSPDTTGFQAYTMAAPVNGSYRQFEPIKVSLTFGPGNPAAPFASSGFGVVVELKVGSAGSPVRAYKNFTGPQSAAPTNQEVSLPMPTNASSAKSGEGMTFTITLNALSGGAPVSGGQNVGLRCGTESKVASFVIARGPPGDGDLDGDGLADSEDSDMDGDGALNAAEAQQCSYQGQSINFATTSAAVPGDHDADGVKDEEECSKGSNALNNLSVPAPPKGLPWGLIIFLVIIVLLIAALVFFVTVYGKAAAITVLSASELTVPPGTQGKFHLEVNNLRKKGNPINFQLSAQGLPDGWDAKLVPDHAVLDPVGGAKNVEHVWLHVETPQHTDPESAVVAVKAIALNTAGRKDTLKLPARVRTITSINVPPNAKVPVKRGAPVKLKSEKELAKEAEPQPAAEMPMASTPVASAGVGEAPAKGKKGKKLKAPEAPTPPVPEPAPAPVAPAPGSKPAIQVGGLTHSPPSFAAGQDVKSAVTVSNNGNDSQTLKLSLFVNDALADAQTVSVKPGKSKEVKFKWTAQERNKLNIRGELVAA